jgi:hypothetical protein
MTKQDKQPSTVDVSKSSSADVAPKQNKQEKNYKQSSTAEVSKLSDGDAVTKGKDDSDQELQDPDFFAYPNDSFSISGDDHTIPTDEPHTSIKDTVGRGCGRGKPRKKGRSGIKLPKRPVALEQQQGWRVIDEDQFEDSVGFEFQHVIVDKLLSHHAAQYAIHLNNTVQQKLQLHSLESTEVIHATSVKCVRFHNGIYK